MKTLFLMIGALIFSVSIYAQVVYQAPTGNLSVTFPAEPAYSTQDLEVEGMNVTLHSYTLSLDTAAYFVAEVTYPASFDAGSDLQDVLKRSANGFFAEFEVEEGSAKKVFAGIVEGAEYQQLTDMFGISYRVFFYKNTLIQMAAMGYGSYLSETDLQSFFNSLNIKR